MISNGVYVIKTYGFEYKQIYHFGILIVNDSERYVYHNSPDNELNDYGGSIRRDEIDEFLVKYKIINITKTSLTEDLVQFRTSKLLGFKYHVVKFNCNSYVRKIAPLYSTMAQDEYVYIAGFTIMISLGLYAGFKKKGF